MAKTKNKKAEIYQQYNDLIDNYQTIVLLDTNSVKTQSVEVFKTKLSESESKYLLLKNTIFTKALEERKPEFKLGSLKGSTGAVFSKDDPSEVLKKVMSFLNENKNIVIKKGVIEGRIVEETTIIEISKLPSKTEMIARTVGTIKSPLSSFVNVLGGIQRNFLYTLRAIEEKKQ